MWQSRRALGGEGTDRCGGEGLFVVGVSVVCKRPQCCLGVILCVCVQSWIFCCYFAWALSDDCGNRRTGHHSLRACMGNHSRVRVFQNISESLCVDRFQNISESLCVDRFQNIY